MYKRQLQPGDSRPADSLPAGDHQPDVEPAAQPPLPDRTPRRFKPGDGLIHGFYAHKQPDEEVAAVLAEDIHGMKGEFVDLRMLSRRLIAAQAKAETSEQVARLGDAYTQAAAQLGQISKAERERKEISEDEEWVKEWLVILDEAAAENDSAASDDSAASSDVGEDDGGESPSEEFWHMLAERDPEMHAASIQLTEEIASTRLVLRRLFALAMETEEVKELVRYTDKYGQSCIRLMRLLKAEKGMQGRAAELLRELIAETISELNKELGLDLGYGKRGKGARDK